MEKCLFLRKTVYVGRLYSSVQEKLSNSVLELGKKALAHNVNLT